MLSDENHYNEYGYKYVTDKMNNFIKTYLLIY